VSGRFERTGHRLDGAEKTPWKAALASWIGSVLEYYDFFIYGTAAALVFGKVFFPDSDPATGTLLSFATYGVGYVARPVGAFFMGHIGDRYGRKRVLLLTVSLMASPRPASSRARTRSASSTRPSTGAGSSPASRSAARRPA
jgi:MFS family permease